MASNGFTGKNVKGSDVVFQTIPNSGLGYTFDNNLQEAEAAVIYVGGSEPSEGKNPFDTFKGVDPPGCNFLGGK